MSWAVVALVSLAATLILAALSATASNPALRKADLTFTNVGWTYAGFFAATAVSWGLYLILCDYIDHGWGYGDGTIF